MGKSVVIIAGMLIGVSFGLILATILEQKLQWISAKHAGVMAVAATLQVVGIILGIMWRQPNSD